MAWTPFTRRRAELLLVSFETALNDIFCEQVSGVAGIYSEEPTK